MVGIFDQSKRFISIVAIFSKKMSKMSSTSTSTSPQKRMKTDNMNCYSGWEIPFHDAPIDRRVLDDSFTPVMFFEEYISKRRPVLLIPQNSSNSLQLWNLKFHKWSYDYLREVAGSSKVRIERRSDLKDKFGCGCHSYVPFSNLVSAMENLDQKIYLTTQDLSLTEEGMPAIMGTPCAELYAKGDFPLRPKFMGNLIPMNINLWWGCSSGDGGSSSGLHHDYHDNIYCLIKGRKRFTLFSPKDALNLYTVGEISHVHSNGRINYKDITTFADGSNETARRAMDADDKVREAELKLNSAMDSGDAEAIEQAESELESALDAMVDVEVDECDDDDEEEDDEDDNDGQAATELSDDEDREVKSEGTPVSFSQIKDDMNDWEAVTTKFPKLKNTVKTTVEVKAGELLYLPSGWFHEVFSLPPSSKERNSSNSSSSSSFEEGEEGGDDDGEEVVSGGGVGEHMAFNYWFHPPDNADFDKPYSSPFWNKEFAKRDMELE
jgi:hypothetical protein